MNTSINTAVSRFFKLCLRTQEFVALAVSVEDLFWNKKPYFKQHCELTVDENICPW
jgi:hypothetical protein